MRYAPAPPVTADRTPVPADALGESATPTGFRRVSLGPAPLALARLRELLLDIARGGTENMRAALEGFETWRSLAPLAGSDWAAGARRSSPAARRVLERRLRALGARALSVRAAAQLPVGSTVHVRGTIRPAVPLRVEGGLTSHICHIWSHGAMTTDNVRFEVEEGHDFFLTDDEGQTARVIAARGHLLDAAALDPGDRVSVFGFTDRAADRALSGADWIDGEALGLALRAGDDLPLIVRARAQERHGGHRSEL
jgi:hypothetical protein